MTEQTTIGQADYRARCYVNGVRKHGGTGVIEPAPGEFSDRFLPHPWVRESLTEGWGRELRSHLILTVKRRLIEGLPIDRIEDLMPDRSWVDAAKYHAEIYRKAKVWREEKYGKSDGEALLRRLGIFPSKEAA